MIWIYSMKISLSGNGSTAKNSARIQQGWQIQLPRRFCAADSLEKYG